VSDSSTAFKARFADEPELETVVLTEPRVPSVFTLPSGRSACVRIPYWRAADGSLIGEEFSLHIYPPELGANDDASEQFAASTVVRVRLRFEAGDQNGRKNAILTQWVGRAEDADLQCIANELQQPFVTVDPYFGRLVLDRRRRIVTGRCLVAKRTCNVSIDADLHGRSDLALARRVVERFADGADAFRAAAIRAVDRVTDLSGLPWPLRNIVTWRIRLQSVSVASDGSVVAFYSDGGLAGGHVVMLDVDAEGRFVDAAIAG